MRIDKLEHVLDGDICARRETNSELLLFINYDEYCLIGRTAGSDVDDDDNEDDE